MLFREYSYSVARSTKNLAHDTVSANQNTTEQNCKEAKYNEDENRQRTLLTKQKLFIILNVDCCGAKNKLNEEQKAQRAHRLISHWLSGKSLRD